MERLSVTSRYDCAVCICLCLLPAAWMAGHARGSWNTEELNRKAKGMHRIPFRLERIPAISDHDAMIPSFQLSNSFVESECGTAFKPLPHRKPQANKSSHLRVCRLAAVGARNYVQTSPPNRDRARRCKRAARSAPHRPAGHRATKYQRYVATTHYGTRSHVRPSQTRKPPRHESGHVVGGGAEGVAIGFWETQQPAHGPGSGALSPVYALSRCQ